MLLLITGSVDGTSDLIVDELGSENVFRFNFDLFHEYKLRLDPHSWEIINPTGKKICSNSVSSAFWWKAFSYFIQNQDDFIIEEVKYIFREIYNWCFARGLVKGNRPDYHNSQGKINILHIASKYLAIPQTLVTVGCHGISTLADPRVVAKSLTSGTTATNKVLFTTEVAVSELHPRYPWYLQEKITSTFDATVFICGKKLFAYQKSRAGLQGLDWRQEQDLYSQKREWETFDLSSKVDSGIRSLISALNVNWGRIDFMEKNGELVFLEFNANGQWVFLDYDNSDNLVHHVCKYLTSR
jgi:hypothetical protein